MFSRKIRNIPEAMSIRFNQMVYEKKKQGERIITLSLGEAFFDIPPFCFSEADFKQGYHYTDSRGLPALREKIASHYQKSYQGSIDPDPELLITAGSKIAIYMALQCLLNDGDEVFIHEPAWVSYTEQVHLLGGVPKFFPYWEKVDAFEAYLTPKTKVIILNNPNNPTGYLYSKNELKLIYKICQARGIFLLVDEAYSDFVPITSKFYSAVNLSDTKENLVVVNSLSKNFGMSGWRVGYAIGHADFIRQLLKVNQHLVTCAPTFLQIYMSQHFDKVLEITLPQVQQLLLKRARVKKLIDELGLFVLEGDAAFYFFLKIDAHNSMEFALNLFEKHGISVVPGIAYGENCHHFVRVSIGTESIEAIKEALSVIKTELVSTPLSLVSALA